MAQWNCSRTPGNDLFISTARVMYMMSLAALGSWVRLNTLTTSQQKTFVLCCYLMWLSLLCAAKWQESKKIYTVLGPASSAPDADVITASDKEETSMTVDGAEELTTTETAPDTRDEGERMCTTKYIRLSSMKRTALKLLFQRFNILHTDNLSGRKGSLHILLFK